MDLLAFSYVLGLTLLHIGLINTGLYDDVSTELGYEMYAEKIYSIPGIPINMPMNTLINFGYLAVGVYWLRLFILRKDFFGESFSWYSIIYTFIQLYRIVFQTQRSAVLDQWITTTIFSHVLVWVTRNQLTGIITSTVQGLGCKVVILVSLLSYSLSLVSLIGFDVSLVMHIFIVVWAAYEVQVSNGNNKTFNSFIKAIMCCFGFVVLKLADLPLREFWTPNCLSGHFLSKICDIGQIYYVAQFVYFIQINKLRQNNVD